jgi:hypothetical protein
MDFSFLTGCASQFWQITSGVCRAVTTCLGGGGRPATLPVDLAMACYHRVNRAQHRLLALMERVRMGRQHVGGSRVAPVLAAGEVPGGLPRASKPVGMVLPRRFGWLVHLVGYQAAGHASQLAHLLGDPEMVALVRDVPQARRILTPLCRMLGVECDGLRVARRVRVRVRAAVALSPKLGVGDLAPEVAPERVGYRPSAKWPRGVVTRRRVGRLKPP